MSIEGSRQAAVVGATTCSPNTPFRISGGIGRVTEGAVTLTDGVGGLVEVSNVASTGSVYSGKDVLKCIVGED
jgi:hypothetical protein